MESFFDFVNISPNAFIAFYGKIRLVLTYGILVDPVTYSNIFSYKWVCHEKIDPSKAQINVIVILASFDT